MDRNMRAAWFGLAVLMIAFMVAMIHRAIISLLVTPIQSDLSLTDTEFGLLSGFAFALFYLIMGLPFGRLADQMSRKVLIAAGIVVWSAMTVICGLAQNFTQLFFARMGLGVAQAPLSPAAYSMLADLFPKDKLGRAMAIYSAGSLIGIGLSFAVGGGIIAAIDAAGDTLTLPLFGTIRNWQAVFIIVGLPGFLIALLMLAVPEPTRSGGPNKPTTSVKAAFQFLYAERKVFTFFFSATACQAVLFYGFFAWMPAWFIRHFALDAGTAGIAIGVGIGIAAPIGAFIGGTIADRWIRSGKRDAHMRVGLVAALGALPFILAFPLADNWMFGVLLLYGTFSFLSMSASSAAAGLQLITPSYLRAQISAFYVMLSGITGIALGSLIIALITDHVFEDKAAVGDSMAVVGVIFAALMALGYYVARSHFAGAYSRAQGDTATS